MQSYACHPQRFTQYYRDIIKIIGLFRKRETLTQVHNPLSGKIKPKTLQGHQKAAHVSLNQFILQVFLDGTKCLRFACNSPLSLPPFNTYKLNLSSYNIFLEELKGLRYTWQLYTIDPMRQSCTACT